MRLGLTAYTNVTTWSLVILFNFAYIKRDFIAVCDCRGVIVMTKEQMASVPVFFMSFMKTLQPSPILQRCLKDGKQ